MFTRLPKAIFIGLIAALVALIVLAIISALLPGVNIVVTYWAGVVGILAFLIYLFTGESIVS